MNSNREVHIVLSTYNGEHFLDDQLRSIEQQTHARWRLFVRDDGSIDGTVDIATRFCGARNQHFCRGEHAGVFGSYFRLLHEAGDAPYYAFCDQDDLWLPDKLSRAVQKLEAAHSADEPALYYSNIRHEQGGVLRTGARRGWRGALVENKAPGCTIVINAAARDLLAEATPAHMRFHDWWCYLVISALGRVIYDPYESVIRRIHGQNASYFSGNAVQRLSGRLHRLARGDTGAGYILHQADEFRKAYSRRLNPQMREYLDRFLSVRCGSAARRLKRALALKVHRERLLDRALLKVMLAFCSRDPGIRAAGND
jgi:glycosyltransferase involved in cell wall biosynthesis